MDDLARAESALRAAAIAIVERDNPVRVEDYLTVLAAATGVGALAAAGFDVDGHDLVPGSGLFFEPVNELLTGDPPVAAGSVYAILHSLVPASVPFTAFPSPIELYAHTARSIGEASWGKVSRSAPGTSSPLPRCGQPSSRCTAPWTRPSPYFWPCRSHSGWPRWHR